MSKRIFDNDEVYKLGAISNAFEAERDELKQRAEAAEARATELAAQLATAQAALEQVTKERDAAAQKITSLKFALSGYRACNIADDYAHLVGGECGYTVSLRKYAEELSK